MRFIGNKTQILDNIQEVISKHTASASSFCDIFSGTASVARFFKHDYQVYSNDLLYFSYCLQKATIENPCIPDFAVLSKESGINDPIGFFNNMPTAEMESLETERRFFQNNYAPIGGRMYVTDSNALRIDYSRNLIEAWNKQGLLSENEYFYLIAAVIEGIPFVSNISGTYGAFNKSWDIRSGKIFQLQRLPVYNNRKNNRSFNTDGTELLRKISGDILYIDPPYNERQYLPNYHVLETAAKYDFPRLSGITGQRQYELQKSDFCSRKTVVSAFDALIANASFRHIILSYNTDGIMTIDEIETILKKYGVASSFEVNYIPYRRFKSRTIATKNDELKEMLVYIRKEV